MAKQVTERRAEVRKGKTLTAIQFGALSYEKDLPNWI